jgi:uncharacterized protein (TIGR00730 family)
MKSVAVFCGSSPGFDPEYGRVTALVGRAIAERNMTTVYGGASVGAMGTLADAALEHGGRVVGVLPRQLVEKEIGHAGLSEMHAVDSMHERKKLMSDLADGFIALPGGFGTLDELAEILTWAQLGLHRKPVALLNTLGFFDELLAFLDHAVDQGFLRRENRSALIVSTSPEEILDEMNAYTPTSVGKWIDGNGTELPVP